MEVDETPDAFARRVWTAWRAPDDPSAAADLAAAAADAGAEGYGRFRESFFKLSVAGFMFWYACARPTDKKYALSKDAWRLLELGAVAQRDVSSFQRAQRALEWTKGVRVNEEFVDGERTRMCLLLANRQWRLAFAHAELYGFSFKDFGASFVDAKRRVAPSLRIARAAYARQNPGKQLNSHQYSSPGTTFDAYVFGADARRSNVFSTSSYGADERVGLPGFKWLETLYVFVRCYFRSTIGAGGDFTARFDEILHKTQVTLGDSTDPTSAVLRAATHVFLNDTVELLRAPEWAETIDEAGDRFRELWRVCGMKLADLKQHPLQSAVRQDFVKKALAISSVNFREEESVRAAYARNAKLAAAAFNGEGV